MQSETANFRELSEIKADKRFFRLHRPFADAVRTGKISEVV